MQTREINSKEYGTEKEIRSDNTYIISQDTTDNPKLGAKSYLMVGRAFFLITILVIKWYIVKSWIDK